ncbi:hypothetical protein [Sodalinema gerasimenkoae]|jgi:hypothetical protein|nr:hypothetical protein [Sodalinema gerasimenkoae]
MTNNSDRAFLWGVVVTLGLGAGLSFALHLETLRAEYRGYRDAVEYLQR